MTLLTKFEAYRWCASEEWAKLKHEKSHTEIKMADFRYGLEHGPKSLFFQSTCLAYVYQGLYK